MPRLTRARFTGIAALLGALGAWVAACNALLDGGSFHYGPCTVKGERRCVDNALQVCGADGEWTGGEACTSSACNADAGKCVGECTPQSKRCDPDGGAAFQTCDPAGRWDTGTSCNRACWNGGCTLCVPGDLSCSAAQEPLLGVDSGDWLIKCGEQGTWELWQDVSCPCVGGRCKPCKPGDKACFNNKLTTCGDDGEWPDGGGTICDAGTVCNGAVGQCVKPCQIPDIQCNGETEIWTCNGAGTWDVTLCTNPCAPCKNGQCQVDEGKPCTAPCVTAGTCSAKGTCEAKDGGAVVCADVDDALCNRAQCDPSTGRCSGPDSASCDSGDSCAHVNNDEEKCSGGVCEGTIKVDHAWAHWSFTAPAPSPRFVTTSDVVYDAVTHLMWQRTPSSDPMTHEDAENYCLCLNNNATSTACLPIPGYPSGWRLPTRVELASLVRYEAASTSAAPLIDSAFNLSSSNAYWTATKPASSTPTTKGLAWSVDFTTGFISPLGVDNKVGVRCVR